MNVIVHHKVKDYNTWKTHYDNHASMRQAAGSKGAHLMQSQDDPNDILISIQFDTIDQARAFASDPSLPKVMEAAGVIGAPDLWFVESVERAPA